MMKIVLYFVILFGMLSCNQNKYKYRVVGQVRVYNLGVCETHNAVWYVNKLSLVSVSNQKETSPFGFVTLNKPFAQSCPSFNS